MGGLGERGRAKVARAQPQTLCAWTPRNQWKNAKREMSALSPVARALLRHPVGRVQGNGITATVFGCTGTLGRYVCAELGAQTGRGATATCTTATDD